VLKCDTCPKTFKRGVSGSKCLDSKPICTDCRTERKGRGPCPSCGSNGITMSTPCQGKLVEVKGGEG